MNTPTKMGNDYCPVCKHLCDRASSAYGQAVPDPGDITVCFYCTSVNVFGDDMALRVITEEELAQLNGEMKLKLLSVIQAIIDGQKIRL